MFRKMTTLLLVFVLGFLVMWTSGDCSVGTCASMSVEWNDNNGRITKVHVNNGHAYPIAVQVLDAQNNVLLTQVYQPGQHTQNVPGSAARFVEVVQVPPEEGGGVEIITNGINFRFLDPAPAGAVDNPSNAFQIQGG